MTVFNAFLSFFTVGVIGEPVSRIGPNRSDKENRPGNIRTVLQHGHFVEVHFRQLLIHRPAHFLERAGFRRLGRLQAEQGYLTIQFTSSPRLLIPENVPGLHPDGSDRQQPLFYKDAATLRTASIRSSASSSVID